MENDRIFEYKEIRKNALKRLKSLAIGLTLFAFFVFIIFGFIDSQREVEVLIDNKNNSGFMGSKIETVIRYGTFLEESKFANFGMWFFIGGIFSVLVLIAQYIPISIAEIKDADMQLLISEISGLKEDKVALSDSQNLDSKNEEV